jgi:hypothetical protein
VQSQISTAAPDRRLGALHAVLNLDGVSIQISDVCVVHARRVLAPIEKLSTGRLHSLDRGIDTIG